MLCLPPCILQINFWMSSKLWPYFNHNLSILFPFLPAIPDSDGFIDRPRGQNVRPWNSSWSNFQNSSESFGLTQGLQFRSAAFHNSRAFGLFHFFGLQYREWPGLVILSQDLGEFVYRIWSLYTFIFCAFLEEGWSTLSGRTAPFASSDQF